MQKAIFIKSLIIPLAIRLGTQAIAFLPPFLVLHSYGAKGLGLFSMLIAISTISAIMEWGRPQALQNAISREGREHRFGLRWMVSIGLFRPLAINLCLAFLLWYTGKTWLGVIVPAEILSEIAERNLPLLLTLIIAAVASSTFHGQVLLSGLGHVDKAYTCGLLANGIVLAIVVVLIHLRVNVELVAVVCIAGPLLDRTLANFYCALTPETIMRSSYLQHLPTTTLPKQKDWRVAASFLYLQILSFAANNIDSLFVSRTKSIEAVGEYTFFMKLFGLPLLAINILCAQYLPRFAIESRTLEDAGAHSVGRLVRNGIFIALGTGTILFIVADPIYQAVSGTGSSNTILAAALLFYVAIMAIRLSLTAFINASEVLLCNVVGNTVFSVATIVLKVFAIEHYGSVGLVVSNALSYLVFLLPFHLGALSISKSRAKRPHLF